MAKSKRVLELEKQNKTLKILLGINTSMLLIVSVLLIAISFQLKGNIFNGGVNKDELKDFDFKVDNIDYVESKGKVWNDHIFAPFVDVCAWVNGEYSVGGTLNLGKVMDDIDIQYFNLGFITATPSHSIVDNKVSWGFGGFDVLTEGVNNDQYNGIKQVINDVRSKGGDVCISIGGLNEGNFFQVTNDVNILTNSYLEIVDGFNLTRLDLDIEGGSLAPHVSHESNAKAIKKLQELTNVEIVLTLPVMPEGLIYSGLETLRTYINEGVDITAVNIMGMCYGASYYDRYDTGTVDAIDNTMKQIKELYSNVGITLTDQEAYNKLAITTSIGDEGYGHPIFTPEMTKLVVDHSLNKKLNFISYWCLNRDSMTQVNAGIKNKYEHAKICLR